VVSLGDCWRCSVYLYVCKVVSLMCMRCFDGDNEGDDDGEGGSEGRRSLPINLQYLVFYTEWDLSSMHASVNEIIVLRTFECSVWF
jgi:hypothetical protein